MGKVSIIVGNNEELEKIQELKNIFDKFNIFYSVYVISGFDSLEPIYNFVEKAEKENVDVIIVCSGLSTHLASIISSKTVIPVVAVCLPTNNMSSNDIFFLTIQTPEGVPVACMSFGKSGIKNAGIFALELISLREQDLKEKIRSFKEEYV